MVHEDHEHRALSLPYLGLGELRHTRVYQEAMQEQGAVMVLQLLSHRFGEVSPEKQAQIQQLSASQPTKLAIALLEFSSLQDFDLWLQTQPLES